MVRRERDATGKGEAEMKPNEITENVCNRYGHKLTTFDYGQCRVYCLNCGMSLEEIREEGLGKEAPSDGS